MSLARLVRICRHRLRSLVRRDEVDAELDREVAYHLEALIEEKVADGLSPAEARRAARREFGNVAAIVERSRAQRRVGWIDDLRQDVVYGWRMLRRSPGVAAVAVISIGLGVGGNAAVLGAIDSALVQGLPPQTADRLVFIDSLSTVTPDLRRGVSINEYLSWRRESTTLDALEAIFQSPTTIGADAGAYTERLAGLHVTGSLFATLEAEALAGRTFTFEESRLIDPVPAVVISERLWRRRYAADPGVVGTEVRINGAPRTVVGVMSSSFRFQAEGVDIWLPLRLIPQTDERDVRPLRVIGRLAPGVSREHAVDELERLSEGLATTFPASQADWRLRVRSLDDALLGWSREPLLMLQTGAVFVWLIACANVAGLLLARGSVRQREIGMRVALGAARGRIVRQLLAETLLVAAAGSVLALGVARLGLTGLSAMSPPLDAPALGPMRIDATTFAVVLALSLVSALLAGLVPALAASHVNPLAAARSSEGETGSAPRHRTRAILVAGQFALALALMIGAALLAHSAVRLAGRPLHIDPDRVATFDVTVPLALTRIGAIDGRPYFDIVSPPEPVITRVLDGLRTLPGVASAGGSSYPMVNSLIVPRYEVMLDGPSDGAIAGGRPVGEAVYYIVTPGLFETLRTPVARGRTIAAADTGGTPWVAVVNETAARRFWPDDEAVGQRIRLDTVPEDRTRVVVGVVADIPRGHGETEPEPIVYASYRQQPTRWRAPWPGLLHEMTFVVRSVDDDPLTILPAAGRVVASVDPDLPLARAGTLPGHLAAATRRIRYTALLLVVLGCTAAGLAAMGIYGTMSYVVSQRRREIGIRKALGATSSRIAGLVAGRAILLVGSGVAIGLAAAVPLAGWLEPQLWGIGPRDPATYAMTSVGLVVVAASACYLPTRRALAVDPVRTLYSE